MALALMAGLAGGAVLALTAGARRSSTAFERYRQETLAGDIDITPSDPDPSRFEAVERLPEVVALSRMAFPFIRPQGTDLYPYLDFLAAVGPDGTFGTRIDRPRMVDGRMPRPERIDEFAATERFATEADLSVGDRVVFESFAPDQFGALFGEGGAVEPAGPIVTLTMTGIAAHPDDLSESLGSFAVRALLPQDFYREYSGEIGIYEGGARVRLRQGADVTAVVRSVREIYRGDPGVEIQLARELGEKIADSIDVLVTALILCALFAGVAGMVAVGQALGRHVAGEAGDQTSLGTLGMTHRQRTAASTLSALPVAVGGAVTAVVVAVAASPLLPVGLARKAERDLGFWFDGAVLAYGFVAIVVIVTTLTTLSSWFTSRVTSDESLDRSAGGRGPALVRALALLGVPAATSIGVRMALKPGRGTTAVPVGSALAGIVFGVVGLVSVALFTSSLDGLVATPSKYGFPWDAAVAGFRGGVIEEHGDDLVADPAVRDLGTVTSSLAQIDGRDVNVYTFESLKGTAGPTLLEGRMPTAADEVVLGSATLRDAGLRVGGVVRVIGSSATLRLRVVGRGAFPILDERGGVGTGAALIQSSLESLVDATTLNRDLVITWADGFDEGSANREVERRTGAQVIRPKLPAEANNLKLVEATPRLLGVFLALLAALALTHTLVTTVRRRRHEHAVLRALGFDGRQLSSMIAWQATTLVSLGIVLGVPLGIAIGRIVWTLVARRMGVVEAPTTPALALVLLSLGALLAANVFAAVPARMARAISPAAVLRTE